MVILKKGDIVKLVTGSSSMKIIALYGINLVECMVIDGISKSKTFFFRPQSLRLV